MIQPKTSVFALPLLSWQQTSSTRVRKFEVQDEHKVGRKRRRSEVVDLTQDSDDLGTTDFESGLESSQNLTQYPVLTPDEAHQYRVAGLSLDQELPGADFPHAAVKDKKRKRSKRLARKLQEQWPPIFLPGSQTTEATLHIQHLGVLTTILHRCLLEGDFVRAGRVWGMLLHEKFGKDPIDIRHGGRWGIGAEILFRQNTAGTNTSNSTSHIFTRPGFEAAKAYYERLIIQYPSRSARSSASSSLQFYPAMFSLWVYVVDHESKVAREALEEEEDEIISERSADLGANMLGGDDNTHRDGSVMGRMAGIRRKELAGAQEIAARMDEIMVGPPYSDSPALLRLRGMVALWIGDLQFSSLGHQEEEEEDANMSDDEHRMSRSGSASRLLASRELHIALERRAVESAKANDLFAKAKARQQGASQATENLDL
ncbi:hypothetical protein TMatcc_000979 [Talaromyces marneffei ATCC 18224]|uniref:RNA polymerase I-specific transcription initiation factor rrn11 n=2 Tax=Talaromyces marneffei TaxID=37727 RepID=B6QP23_TALMQ|nr:uncharacterized protein EYB26_003510 [Talaromyces marneffei]EEA20974.1 conserved hypothetical protein [Talaromyces marneffei ATCC 18224]KAE8549925.1 hypothetical protein EYB25_008450 [Talaromyces marneffei]QGA15849.1 hypothetical protein EYB26_003510 [Talaromyces marneffei]